MFKFDQKKVVIPYLITGIGTWIIFLSAFLFLTQALMFFMDFESLAIIFLIVGLVLLFLNYLVFKLLFSYSPKTKKANKTPIQNYHEIFSGLERLFKIIVILVTLGFMSSLTTFFFASMTYFNTHDFMQVIQLTPVLLLVYLLFTLPSFYGLREINNLKLLLNDFDNMKIDIRKVLNLNGVSD
ncbi:MAG: hypothetical protein HeimC3_10700 [Candidatus Heimdallarchaeota archaeon LC_3]|nr:MAG: hypothetical protein HeimC3_10700 [Candidatus Heimdallarchaeota archaeon LC_3]